MDSEVEQKSAQARGLQGLLDNLNRNGRVRGTVTVAKIYPSRCDDSKDSDEQAFQAAHELVREHRELAPDSQAAGWPRASSLTFRRVQVRHRGPGQLLRR